jgi:hypothetical protein
MTCSDLPCFNSRSATSHKLAKLTLSNELERTGKSLFRQRSQMSLKDPFKMDVHLFELVTVLPPNVLKASKYSYVQQIDAKRSELSLTFEVDADRDGILEAW